MKGRMRTVSTEFAITAARCGPDCKENEETIVKTGSDVHFELTELLPRLRSGVIVHFHDFFHPFEYPRSWIIDQNHSWNEIYFVQAFLMFNQSFEVMYFNDFFAKRCYDNVKRLFPKDISSRIRLNPGGGLWLRRI